jgi:hypothetical protein
MARQMSISPIRRPSLNVGNGLPRSRRKSRKRTILSESKQAHSISVIKPPEELAIGGDIVDAVRALGWNRERVLG